MSRFPYQFFDEYVFRTPVISYKKFYEKAGNSYISNSDLQEICNNAVFQEALYLASPYVYKELERWLNLEKEFPEKEFQKLKNTIIKYFSRASTRCTPFGLFSEVGLGKFSSLINVSHDPVSEKIRDTKIDMHFLVGLADYFTKIPEIKNKLLYFSNNSIYQIGSRIRYVEYEYTKEKREYIISSAPLSEELDRILKLSRYGKTIQQLTDILIDDELTETDAKEFIDELIDNQILISELEPNVSGPDYFSLLIARLKSIGAEEQTDILIAIQKKIKVLDQKLGNAVNQYGEIEKLLHSLNCEYKANHLFQTDVYSKKISELPHSWKKELKKGICFLNKIFNADKETHIEKFKTAFYERFETQEISLAYVLDTEVGIGYRQDIATKGLHPYLEDLELPQSSKKAERKVELGAIHQILNEKWQEAQQENKYSIELSDEDFEDFKENWQDLPDTFSMMAEIISENNKEKLALYGGGGISAANLSARFCSDKADIQSVVKSIAKKEEELNSDVILAEIIHLPQARIGNIIRRPVLRKYEIPYLAQSVLPKENQIFIDDLYISLRNDRFFLRSKKHNKEVKPYLTNAHNYPVNSLPVYHFLCDLHTQDMKPGLYFGWGDLKYIYHFFPRVEYKNIILANASWKITEKEIKQFSLLMDDQDLILLKIKEWRKKRQIPQWIQWCVSDNKLTINLDNYDMVTMFFDAIKNDQLAIIEEFLHNENDDFKKEYVFSLHKEN